jgi:kynurenine formamidase
MKIKWIGVDCGSADHPMNTIIRTWHPARFQECDAYMKKKYGKSFDEIFPIDKYYQVMHLDLFPKGIVHAENLAGDINKMGSTRCYIGCFPLRGIEMESSMCRIVAWLPPKEAGAAPAKKAAKAPAKKAKK